jgi:hypothetical protein
MWVETSEARRAVYNLAAFAVVFPEKDLETDTWLVLAMDAEGKGRVKLAEADSEEGADNLVRAIAGYLQAQPLGAE